jgi:hypothetical protein
MKQYILLTASIVLISGCATLEKTFKKDCEVQAAVVEEAIITAAKTIGNLSIQNVIGKNDGMAALEKLADARISVVQAGSICPLDEAKAIEGIAAAQDKLNTVQESL